MDQQHGTAAGATGHKTYVFVDEYNRHKRLKVMRACDGCRKRKIRCDGALQNGPWPCGACLRLKLKCVPPTLDHEDEQLPSDGAATTSQFSFHTVGGQVNSQPNGNPSQATMVHEWSANVAPGSNSSATTTPTSAHPRHEVDASAYSNHFYGQQVGSRFDPTYSENEYLTSTSNPVPYQSNRAAPPSLVRSQTEASNDPSGDPHEVDAAVKELSEQMGDLAIHYTAAAPYIANEKKTLAETPAVEEVEVILPPSVGTDSTVRIPPEMMPSEERAIDCFRYYFEYIHPYVPVLNRQMFYEQWHNARHSISPLILEGIFACTARYLDEPIEVRRWLALAARHEESFKDVPRLSTIQALIILTKAREFLPKRGYFFRSWMAVKYMTTMAFDLGLHEHLDQHATTNGCKLPRSDCMIRTRVWQTLFCLEIWIGATQGRTDFAVELETVDFSLPAPSSEIDAFELHTTRRTAYFAQSIRNIKQTNTLWQSMRRVKKDWALDPMFVRQNGVISTWLKNLPPDLQIQYQDDDSPPWLGGDHFTAYLHVYHHLVVIMHHRPQLQTLLEKRDPAFKIHLDICNEAAALMCRLQEAIYRDFHMHGLHFMQRGINFNIYCILTCTMLHLATITSPDPVTNSRARKYFTRHMRLLESSASGGSPEMQQQITNLREAFSQDTSKPFELKAGLGLRSPSTRSESTPPAMQQSDPVQSASQWGSVPDSSKSVSPTGDYPQSFQGPALHGAISYNTTNFTPPPPPPPPPPSQTAYAQPNMHHVTSVPQQGYTLEPVISNEAVTPVWDPSGIFHNWNTAFGPQAQAQAQALPQQPPQMPDPRLGPTSAPVMTQQQSPGVQHPLYASQQMPQNAVPEAMPAMPTVTPVMWQDAFTNAYASGHGHKRYRDDGLDATGAYNQYQKRRG